MTSATFDNKQYKSAYTQLSPDRFPLVAPWFSSIDGADFRLASIAEVGGGRVYADDPENPAAACVEADDGFCYLAGSAENTPFLDSIVKHLLQESLPARVSGDRQAMVFSSDDRWKALLDERLAPLGGFRIRRHTFAFDGAAFLAVCAALPPLPGGYAVRPLRGFDAAVYRDGEEAARCSAVFSGAGSVEIAVHTAEAHRRRGLALHACAAFIRRCMEAGMKPHWSCWDYNAPSLYLALKLGFRRLPDLEVNFCDLG